MGKKGLLKSMHAQELAEPISEEDVLLHFASVAQIPRPKRTYVHPPIPTQPIKRLKKKDDPSISQTSQEFASSNGDLSGSVRNEPERPASSTSPKKQSARRTSPGAGTAISPRNILPPPPPLDDGLRDEPSQQDSIEPDASEETAAGASSSDPRPQWTFTTTPLPPHLHRQAQLRPSAAPSNVSEEDVSEVDELATPGDGKGTAGAGDGALTGSPGRRGRLSEAGGNLLSLPRKLWSSIRPGILS